MGLSSTVQLRSSLAVLLEKLPGSSILMVDNQLVSPRLPPPSSWRDVRLKTPAGTVSLKRDGDRVTVTVFGNADEALLRIQEEIGKLLEG